MSNENNTQIETRIIITHKADKAMIGLQQTDCDPVFFAIAGDMATAINRILELVAEAGRRWQTNPRYPKAEIPTPPTPVLAITHPAPNTPSKPAQNSPQTSMF